MNRNAIICKLCGKSFNGSIASHLYWKHNMTKEKYKAKFPNAEIVSLDWTRNQSLSHAGQKAWNEGKTKETSTIIREYSKTLSTKEFTEDHKQHISETKIEQFKNKEFSQRIVRNLDNANFHRAPNKPEKMMETILNKYFPNKWKYVGDGSLKIGSYNPDFININGKKQLIEVFGDYWHKDSNLTEKAEYYRKYGFETLIVWENELYNNPEEVLDTIRKFDAVGHANPELSCNTKEVLHKCVETTDSASLNKK